MKSFKRLIGTKRYIGKYQAKGKYQEKHFYLALLILMALLGRNLIWKKKLHGIKLCLNSRWYRNNTGMKKTYKKGQTRCWKCATLPARNWLQMLQDLSGMDMIYFIGSKWGIWTTLLYKNIYSHRQRFEEWLVSLITFHLRNS